MEPQSHQGDGAPSGTPNAPADSVSQGASQAAPSSGTVPPEQSGDNQPFYEEGGKVFQTKEDYILHVNQQRGAASRLAARAKELEEENKRLREAGGQKPADPTAAPTVEEIDEQTKQAIETLKKLGKFATIDEINAVKEQIQSLQAERQALQQEQVKSYVDKFIKANPKASDALNELAEIVTTYRLVDDARGTAVEKAYILHFREFPNPLEDVTNQEAYEKGKQAALKKSQAGGTSSNQSGAAPTAKPRDIFDQLLTSITPQ